MSYQSALKIGGCVLGGYIFGHFQGFQWGLFVAIDLAMIFLS